MQRTPQRIIRRHGRTRRDFLFDAPTVKVKPTPKHPLKHLRASDLRVIAQLKTQATAGVTQIVEDLHQSMWRTLGLPGGE